MDLRDIDMEGLPEINDSYIDFFADFETDALIVELQNMIKVV